MIRIKIYLKIIFYIIGISKLYVCKKDIFLFIVNSYKKYNVSYYIEIF